MTYHASDSNLQKLLKGLRDSSEPLDPEDKSKLCPRDRIVGSPCGSSPTPTASPLVTTWAPASVTEPLPPIAADARPPSTLVVELAVAMPAQIEPPGYFLSAPSPSAPAPVSAFSMPILPNRFEERKPTAITTSTAQSESTQPVPPSPRSSSMAPVFVNPYTSSAALVTGLVDPSIISGALPTTSSVHLPSTSSSIPTMRPLLGKLLR